MSKGTRIGYRIGLVTIAILIAMMLWPGKGGLRSPKDTKRMLAELGVEWHDSGPPIVVFTNPG